MKHDGIPAFTLEPERRAPEKTGAETSRTPRFIEDVAAGRVELPVIPAIVQQLMNALRDPNVDARVVSQALARDPVLTSKVLRLANSSFFGGQRSMTSVDAAVGLICTAAVGALWVESIKFPQAVAATIGKSTRPAQEIASPLELSLHGACALMVAVCEHAGADVARAALHPALRAKLVLANGEPDPAFSKLYESLCEAENPV